MTGKENKAPIGEVISDDRQIVIETRKFPTSRPVTTGPLAEEDRAHQKTKAAQNKLFNRQRTHARRVALSDLFLTGTHKAVLSLMIDRLNPANDWAWQTVRSIAKHLGTGKNVVMETFTRVDGWLLLFERRHPQGNEKYNPIAHWRFPKNILEVGPRNRTGKPLLNWDSDFGFAHQRSQGGPEQGTACTSNGGQAVPETGDKGVPQTGDYNDRQLITTDNECSVRELASPSILDSLKVRQPPLENKLPCRFLITADKTVREDSLSEGRTFSSNDLSYEGFGVCIADSAYNRLLMKFPYINVLDALNTIDAERCRHGDIVGLAEVENMMTALQARGHTVSAPMHRDGRLRIPKQHYEHWKKAFYHLHGSGVDKILDNVEGWLSEHPGARLNLSKIQDWLSEEYENDESRKAWHGVQEDRQGWWPKSDKQKAAARAKEVSEMKRMGLVW